MTQTTPNDDIFPVVIIGGGLAGLTAAIHLAEQDLLPFVIEADTDWAGGRLSGGATIAFDYDGRHWTFSSEHGAHALWGGYHNIRAMLDRYGIKCTWQSTGEEWINRWGTQVRYIEAGNAIRSRWIPAPFHYLQLLFHPRFWGTITPLDFLSLPGFIISIMWTLGFDPIAEKNALEGLTLDEYFRGWTPNLRATFTGLGTNLLASNEEAISLTAFIAAIRFYTMLRRADWRLDYIAGNAGRVLIQPMIDKIRAFGGEVQYGWRAKSLEQHENHWKIRIEDSRLGGVRTIEAHQVIFAVTPDAAQEILLNSPDTADIAKTLRFPEMIHNMTVRLWFKASPREGAPGGMFTGDFPLDNFFWLHRIHDEFRAWHDATGGSVIEVHIYGRQQLFELSERLLIINVAKEIQMAFPELKGHLVHAEVRDNGKNQTRFLVPTTQSLHVETPWQGILACGDWIGYPTPSLWMERSTITGIAAANHVLAHHGLPTFELIPPQRPELLARLIGGGVRIARRIFGPLLLAIARLTVRRPRRYPPTD